MEALNQLSLGLNHGCLGIEFVVRLDIEEGQVHAILTGSVQILQSLNLVVVEKRIKALQENVELIFDDDAGHDVLKQFDVDVIEAFEL